MEEIVSFKLPIDEILHRLNTRLLASYKKGHSNVNPDQFQSMDDFMRFVYLIVVNGPLQALEKVTLADGSLELATTKEAILTNGWDLIGPYWPAIETPTNYFMTMTTLLHFIKEEKVRPGKWLSLGSGPGLYETYLAKKFPLSHITSMDSAESMVNFHESLKNRHAKNQTLLCQSIETLPQEDESQDLVICNNSIQWLNRSKIQKAVQEISRVLKKGGHLFLVVHPHPMQFMASDTTENVPFGENMGVTGEDVFTLAKKTRLKPIAKRIIQGTNTGQLGNPTSRVFIHFKK